MRLCGTRSIVPPIGMSPLRFRASLLSEIEHKLYVARHLLLRIGGMKRSTKFVKYFSMRFQFFFNLTHY